MKMASLAGIVGDSLNFLGAIVLILNEIRREDDYREAREGAKALVKLADINFQSAEGERLANFMDLVLQILRKEGKRAKFGLALIAAGFFLQLFSRMAE